MSYREYLQSNHWREFRQQIFKNRKQCQACGKKLGKGIFNIHHKNYLCLGKEVDSDVLVLCQYCHNQKHKHKKWKRALKLGLELNFVRARDPEAKCFNLSDYFMDCHRCGGKHPVFYKMFKNGTKHLYQACPNSRPRFQALPFIDNLPIPTRGKCERKIQDCQ